jgi:hypothetical protein
LNMLQCFQPYIELFMSTSISWTWIIYISIYKE